MELDTHFSAALKIKLKPQGSKYFRTSDGSLAINEIAPEEELVRTVSIACCETLFITKSFSKMGPMKFYAWNSPDLSEEIVVDCFLPTGVLVPLKTKVSHSLGEIKADLFLVAEQYPLFNRLLAPKRYCFLCINEKGKRERLLDETLKLRDVKPFRPVLKLLERQGDEASDGEFEAKIKFLMGKTPAELEGTQNDEVLNFRQTYTKLGVKESQERRASTWEQRAMSVYPCDVCFSPIPQLVTDNLYDGHFRVNVYLPPSDDHELLNIPLGTLPEDVIFVFRNRTQGRKNTIKNINDYALKVVGKEIFFLGGYKMEEYMYIRNCISKNVKPELSVVPRTSLQVEDYAPMSADPPVPPRIPPKNCLSVWDLNARFKFKLSSATNLSIESGTEIAARAGLFHGSSSLCPVKCSREKQGPSPIWNEYLEFDILMCDIPRMAKLCLTIYAKRKNKEGSVPLAWVNTTLFDFRNYLRQGQMKLHAWPVTDTFQNLNVIGTVVSNINTSTSACLVIEFTQYAKSGSNVMYPPFDKVLEKASTLAGNETTEIFRGGDRVNIDLQQLVEREPLAEYSEEDKKNIWFFRFECRDKYPNSLPKVLSSIKWNNREDVARMQALLRSWPLIQPEQALELLDYKYPESEVRTFAVRCLEQFSDAQLQLFLLQLVQVLKYEAYLDCNLAEFLLKRALWNRKIGHALFWLLRAEMHVPEVSIRFGLLIETYCKGSVGHMTDLIKQVEAMNKLKAITELLQCPALRRADRDVCLETMRKCLQQVTFREAFSNFHSVVDPACKLKNLRENACKMMDSKMRPLMMIFENEDEMGPPTQIIFKNGDDLRQDMLTVQIFRIMDTLWQQEGLNLEMTAYAVLSTGDKIGVIEVVTNAKTLANIQKAKAGVVSGAFKKAVLLDWLKECNTDLDSLDRAIETFTLSCAGYCVATYVLGIGDRHSDNIMVKTTGQLVHIDFGHFLGNFKVKFGVDRERVPFILSRDFVHVITKGKDSDTSPEFIRFKEICEKAYLILRRNSSLFINLFAMMLSTGLPELRTVEDISHLKKTLGLTSKKNVEKNDEGALTDFRKKFKEAYKNSTSTSLNWALHNWRRDNK